MTEIARAALTSAFGAEAWLPDSLAANWRTFTTLALQALPAIDPTQDTWVTAYEPPQKRHCKPFEHGEKPGDGAVLITGATGFVGVHLVEHLLKTTRKRLYCVVRARSAGKILQPGTKFGLQLHEHGYDERVALLDGDCKQRDLGLAPSCWQTLGGECEHVFHLAANSSFVAPWEVLRQSWMPSYVHLLEFCASHGIAFHMVGSVARFAVDPPHLRKRRGVWTSGYMRQKHVQHAVLQQFRRRGLTCSWIDCAYIIGTLRSGGTNPGFHDSLWKAAAIQHAVGLAFPGDATLVPVDLLVAALWLNADRPRTLIAPFMSLRLRAMLTPERIGISVHVGPEQFWEAARRQGYDLRFIKAFVPPDIRELVESMHKDFDAPPEIAKLFDGVDEAAVIRSNYEYAKREFHLISKLLPRDSSVNQSKL